MPHDHAHPHPHRPDQDQDGPLTEAQLTEIALRELLIEKGVLTTVTATMRW